VTLSANSNIAVGGTSDAAALGATAGNIALGTNTLANQNVLTVAARTPRFRRSTRRCQTVSAFQSQLGAIQNRFTAAVSNLQSTART
jgi:flagellin